jgi:hypothetical protein
MRFRDDGHGQKGTNRTSKQRQAFVIDAHPSSGLAHTSSLSQFSVATAWNTAWKLTLLRQNALRWNLRCSLRLHVGHGFATMWLDALQVLTFFVDGLFPATPFTFVFADHIKSNKEIKQGRSKSAKTTPGRSRTLSPASKNDVGIPRHGSRTCTTALCALAATLTAGRQRTRRIPTHFAAHRLSAAVRPSFSLN